MASSSPMEERQPKRATMKESRASPTILPQPAAKRQKISPIPPSITHTHAHPLSELTITFSELEPDIIARVHYELEVDINSPYSHLTDLGKAALIGHLHEKDEHVRRLAYLEVCRSSPTWEGRVNWIREELSRRAPEMVGEFYRVYKTILPPAEKKSARKPLSRKENMEGGASPVAKAAMEKSASLLAKASAKAAADKARTQKAGLTDAAKMLLQSHQSPSSWPGKDEGTTVFRVNTSVSSTSIPAPVSTPKKDDDIEITATTTVTPTISTPKPAPGNTTKKEEIDLTITPNPKIQVIIPSYTPQKSSIMIRLRYSETESMPFRMKRTTIFSHLMAQALKKLGAEIHREFTFKGVLLQPRASPREVGMEEGDVIEVALVVGEDERTGWEVAA